MKLMKKFKYTIQISLFLALISTGGTLHADDFSISGGILYGERTPELESRFFLDDLLENPIGRIDLGWKGASEYSLYPTGITYKKPMGKGKGVINATFNMINPDYKFTGISNGSIALVTVENYSEINVDVDIGYELPLAGNLFVTPFVGGRNHRKSLEISEITLGSPSGMSLKGPFDAVSRSIFVGGLLRFDVNDEISVFGEYRMTTPLLGNLQGSMESSMIRGYTDGSFKYDEATSKYEIDLKRITLGLDYSVTENLHVFGGFMSEKMSVQYTDYFNLPIQVNGGNLGLQGALGPTILEIITDQYIIYNMPLSSTREGIFIGMSYDVL